MEKIQRDIDRVMQYFKRRYRAKAESDKGDPWRVLLFTVLSARSRDVQTEKAYGRLLMAYSTPQKLARAKPKDVEPLLRDIGLYRAKAKNVVRLAREIVEAHGGKVPNTIDELVRLPGVGRKTANCALIYAFRKPAMCVDTHVHRIVNRLGWVRTRTPAQTEFALRKVVPKKYWLDLNRVMVQFGREICTSGKCGRCALCKGVV